MAREHLENRGPWQGKGVARGRGAEDVFHAPMSRHLKGADISAVHKPKDLKGIYGEVEIDVRRKGKLPGARFKEYGIEPEYALRHKKTGRMIFVEIKRQRDRGNAHERACKYMMPGIVESARVIAQQPVGVVPFWWIFTNGLATSPRYIREIRHWFRGREAHLLLWENVRNHDQVINHFESRIRQLLEYATV